MTLRVIVFDDVIAARGESFLLRGMNVDVFADAEDCVALCTAPGHEPDLVFMDYDLGPGRVTGAEAVRLLRDGGFSGTIIAISSDPTANSEMCALGADDSLARKSHLRSYLLHLSEETS